MSNSTSTINGTEFKQVDGVYYINGNKLHIDTDGRHHVTESDTLLQFKIFLALLASCFFGFIVGSMTTVL